MKKENKNIIMIGIVIVISNIIIGITISNYSLNNHNTHTDTKKINNKQKLIDYLLSKGYFIYEDYYNEYIKPDEVSDFGLTSLGVRNYDFNDNTFSITFRVKENGNITYERFSIYNWELKTSQENFSQYSYTNGHKNLVDSGKAIINSNGVFSCNGSKTACDDLKVSMENHKNEFFYTLSQANVSVNDINS